MKQIAARAGVSVATVSRALKDHPRLSQATRERVRTIAREMGYRTHPYVAALMSSLTRTRKTVTAVNLGVFHFGTLEHTLIHSFYAGIRERARELGYAVELFAYEPERIPLDRLKQILMARGIRGLIVMPANEGFAKLEFDFNGFAVATLGHSIVEPPLPRVASDNYQVVFDGLDELRRRGYRRIGMISTRPINELSDYLYSAALMAYGRYRKPRLHLTEYFVRLHAPDNGLAAMKQWIKREKLDAVMSPIFTHHFPAVLKQLGIDGLGYLHLLGYEDPAVTCLYADGKMIGAKGVDLVVAAINRNEFNSPGNPHAVMIPCAFHEGATLPYRPGTSPGEGAATRIIRPR